MISIQQADFDFGKEYQTLRNASKSPGAIACFVGLVRDMDKDSPITGMELEHYPGMTEKSLQSIIDNAQQRWKIDAVRVIHRIGKLKPDDQIVFVGVSSPHRVAAFSACEFVMDYLKTQAPFWKKEHSPNGEHWVEEKQSDQQAMKRWESQD